MGDVIEIHQKRIFTLDEARTLLPVVRRLTKAAYTQIDALRNELSFTPHLNRKSEIEEEIQAIFDEWTGKVRKLGCEVKGIWLVDFDSGGGYYCWHYPEPTIEHFHRYDQGFLERVKTV